MTVAAAPDLSAVAADEWQKARQRFDLMKRLAEKTNRTRACAEQVAEELGCSLTLIYRLLARFQKDPRLTAMLPRPRGRRVGDLKLDASVDEVVRNTIEDFYLTRQKPRIKDVIDRIEERCRALGLPAPSRKAVRLRIAMRSTAEATARREGRKAAHDRFTPAIGSFDAPWPLSIVQIDHTLVDVIVVDSADRQPIQRPWLTLAIDVHSRCVVGFHLSLEAPSATAVALCVAHSSLPKDGWLTARKIDTSWPVAGIPERLHLDNAKEFHSEALRRGCEQYGIGIDYRPVRTPHYGGHIERLIGTMMGKVHLLPGTTFSDIRAKGDLDPEKTAAMTLDEVEGWLTHAICGVYHCSLHRGIQMTPLAAWERGILGDSRTLGRGQPTQVTESRRFLIDFLPIERRLVRRDGVFLHGIGYWSDVLRTWIDHKERMVVRYDPRNLSRIYLLAPDGTYYDLAYRDLRRPPISLWEHRMALRSLRERGRTQIDEEAIFGAVAAMRGIVDRATADTKTARRIRERRRRLALDIQAPGEPASVPATAPVIAPLERVVPLAAHERLFSNVEEW